MVSSGTRLRVLRTIIDSSYYSLNLIRQGYPPVNFDSQKPDGSGPRNLRVNVRTEEHTALVREIGSASAVLLKNNRTAVTGSNTIRGLPLDKSGIKTMAVIGQDAKTPHKNCGELNECNDGTMSIG
jgi:beta-glucosidase